LPFTAHFIAQIDPATCQTEALDLVARQVLRALRGQRSQKAFARRLGYRGNPLTDWEHGRRFPTAREALRAAMLAQVDVPEAFARFAPGVVLELDLHGPRLGAWLSQLAASTTITELSARSGISRFAISRWLAGGRHPRLPDFFRLVDAVTARLPDLVAELVPIEKVPALTARHAAASAARRLAFEEPWTEAILRVLESPAYRALPSHRPGLVAERLGIPLDLEARALSRLEAAHLIRREQGRYCDVRPATVDTRGGREALHALRAHWSLVAAERATSPRPDDVFAYNVLAVSAPDYARIAELLRATYREVRSIVAASEPAEHIALLNVQLMGWNHS
jgi:transcriptional regulator with XRE-family HTH domain